MSRFGFTHHCTSDVEGLTHYLQSLPQIPAQRIGRQIQQAIANIAAFPHHAPVDTRLSLIAQYDVHRLVCGDYLVYYHPGEPFPLILGVIHGRRDVDSIMRRRLG